MASNRSVRIITGSYEHNLLCVALTVSEKGEVFVPVFHFTPHTQSIRCLAASKKFLVSGSNDELIRLYDLQHRKELGTLMHHSGKVQCAEFFGNKWLLSGAGDGRICIWRVKDWELLTEMKGHTKPINDLAIHSSGKIALSVGDDRKLFLWNLMTGRKASVQKLRKTPLKVAWLPDSEGNSYVIGYDKSIVLHSSTSAAPEQEVELKSALQHMAFYQDKWLVVSTNDGSISFFDAKDLTKPAEFVLQGHSSRVKDFSFLDNLMVSASSDGKLVVWDLDKRDQIAVYSCGDRLNCVVMVPDEIETAPPVKRAIADSDAESEPDSDSTRKAANRLRKKRKNTKKAKVIVTDD